MTRVLVVYDDADHAQMLGILLRGQGLEPLFWPVGHDVLPALQRESPDIVLIDRMIAQDDGFATCRTIRAESPVPIVVLAASGDTRDLVAALEAGADDYIRTPFQTAELIARMNARLRRVENRSSGDLWISDVHIDSAARVVRRDGRPILLTRVEFDLLSALAARPGYAFTREQLLTDVWRYQDAGDTRLVNVHVQRLRSKVERDPDRPEVVVTVRGVGYRAGPP